GGVRFGKCLILLIWVWLLYGCGLYFPKNNRRLDQIKPYTPSKKRGVFLPNLINIVLPNLTNKIIQDNILILKTKQRLIWIHAAFNKYPLPALDAPKTKHFEVYMSIYQK
ncbi:MAG: hypothetical protein ABH950_03895, partial [Candidatus Altiarchaeota archaeon]